MYKNIASVCLLSILLSPGAHALDWQLYKFAEIGVRGTDNFRLADTSKELVGSIRPSVDLVFSGNRVGGNVIAEVEAFRFQNEGYEVTDPRLSFQAEGALIPNFMYFSSALDYGKVFPGGDVFDLNEDTEAKTRWRISPFIAGSYGRVADYYFGYGHEAVSDGEFSNQLDTLQFTIGRNARYNGFTWGLGGYYGLNETGSEDGAYNNNSLYASVGQTVGQTLYFQLRAGQETSDFGEATNQFLEIDDRSNLWEATMRWIPSEKTAMTVGFGERFFGTGPSFSLTHTVRNSSLTAGFTRNVTNTSQLLGSVSAFDGDDTGLIPIIGDNATGDIDLADTVAPFVDNRFELSYKLAGRRSDLILDAAYSIQEQLSSNFDSRSLEGRIALDRHLSPLTTFRIQYDLLAEEDDISERQNENRLAFSFIYNFDRRARRSILSE